MEAWRKVEGFSRYEVSNEGRLRSNFGKLKILKGTLDDGYLVTRISGGGVAKGVAIHRLVLQAFRGECPPGMVGHHKDENRVNNHIGNLEYKTFKEHQNLNPVIDNKGEKNGRSKLTVCDIIVMRGLERLTIWQLAQIFDIFESHVWRILHRKAWAHVPE